MNIKIIDFIDVEKLMQYIETVSNDLTIKQDVLINLNTRLNQVADIEIRKCEYCGKLFVPKGKYDTKYCDREAENGFTCKVIGGRVNTNKNIKDNPMRSLYMKYYKRYKGRVRLGKMTENQFEDWKSFAKKQIDIIEDITEFQMWLDKYEDEKSE